MRSLATLTTALLLTLGGSSHAACRFDDAKFYFGFETPMKGEADSGKPCGFAMGVATTGGSRGFRIAQPPHHGVAGIGRESGMPVIAYRSAAGYRGPDEFVVSYFGGDIRLHEMESGIRVILDVK
jgi:hypothetical protein